jgi:Tfp pilus assembly protein PilO
MKDFLKNSPYDKYYRDLLPYFKEEKTQRTIMLVLTFGASIFLLLFAISPTVSTIAKLNKQISDSKFVEGRLTKKISNLSSLSQSYNNISQDISVITDAIPQEPNAPILAALIQGAAKNSSAEITSINVSQIDLGSQPATLSSAFVFSVSAHGSYDSLMNFINSISDMQRAVTIDSLHFTNGGSSSDIKAEIAGSAFYKK